MAEMQIQQSAVERKQGTFRHLGRCWPSTASLLISSRLDFVLPLDLDGLGRESETDDHAQLSPTLIQLTRKSSSSRYDEDGLLPSGRTNTLKHLTTYCILSTACLKVKTIVSCELLCNMNTIIVMKGSPNSMSQTTDVF